MIKPELYQKTTDILFDAYFNDTLEHGSCKACAVGNICLASGVPEFSISHIEQGDSYHHSAWGRVFFSSGNGSQTINLEKLTPEIEKVISATGYTWRELAQIEYAFENASNGQSSDEYMFNGLCRVLEVLKQIHLIENDEPVRQKFNDHYLTLSK